MRSEFLRLALAVLLMCGLVGTTRAESNTCGQPPDESHYVPQSGDTEGAQHLAIERTFSGAGHLELNVCAGELRNERGHGDKLQLRVETGSTPNLKMRAYVKTLEVNGEQAVISLQFPNKVHPVVILELPSTISLKTEVNLGAGKLLFHADEIKGNRELNVGAGNALLMLNGDHDYASFEANVGMGSFHDHRAGGGSAHFVVSKDFTGIGSGQLEVNVGAGSIDVDPAKGDTI